MRSRDLSAASGRSTKPGTGSRPRPGRNASGTVALLAGAGGPVLAGSILIFGQVRARTAAPAFAEPRFPEGGSGRVRVDHAAPVPARENYGSNAHGPELTERAPTSGRCSVRAAHLNRPHPSGTSHGVPRKRSRRLRPPVAIAVGGLARGYLRQGLGWGRSSRPRGFWAVRLSLPARSSSAGRLDDRHRR
jgi:hypothetical protein